MKETLLVVEDEAQLRKLISEVLTEEGYDVLEAADGVAGQEILLQRSADVRCTVMDWLMPRMSGIELLEWMKKNKETENIPVVLQTGVTDPERIKRGIEAGAFYYLTKPVLPTVLVSIVRAAIDDRREKEVLLRQLATCRNPLSILVEGTFEFRTIEEAEGLATIIANASPVPERALAINEIFLNAIEHGNLGITYDEKTGLVEAGTWRQEVDRRLNLPANIGKTVRVRVDRGPEGLTVLVRDCGPGFDVERYLQFDVNRAFDTHGRGIALARAALKLEFEDEGRAVRIAISGEESG